MWVIWCPTTIQKRSFKTETEGWKKTNSVVLKQFGAPLYGGIESIQWFLGQLPTDNSMIYVFFSKIYFESSNEMTLSINRD